MRASRKIFPGAATPSLTEPSGRGRLFAPTGRAKEEIAHPSDAILYRARKNLSRQTPRKFFREGKLYHPYSMAHFIHFTAVKSRVWHFQAIAQNYISIRRPPVLRILAQIRGMFSGLKFQRARVSSGIHGAGS